MTLRALVSACYLIVAAAACDRSAARAIDSSDTTRSSWTVDVGGIGVVRAGMSIQELSATVAEQVRPA